MSQSSWLVAGVLPGIERQPHKKLEPNAEGLLGLLHRWRDEAVRAGKEITRIAVAFEAGRDGFWLARWLGARGVEAHVTPDRRPRDCRRRPEGARLRLGPALSLRRARRHPRARLRRAQPPRHQRRHNRLQIGGKIRLVPGHCDPTVNLYDWYVGIRANRVQQLWPITARGAVY